jgi:hypothetical protein
MKTAVELLFQETLGITFQLEKKLISHRNWELQMVELFKQAKEMEKQQIIDAHGNKQKTKSNPNSIVTYGYTFTGEMYYNETFKKEL